MVGGHLLGPFPAGLWWVGWIDHTIRNIKAVHVVLVRYQAERVAIDDLSRFRDRVYVCLVDRAAMPLIACGDIYLDKRTVPGSTPSSVMSVCDETPFGALRTFNFDTEVLARGTERSRGYGMDQVTSLDATQNAYDVYPLCSTKNSKVLVVDASDGCRYLIPAAELIRSLVAPQSRLLSAIFGENLFPFIDKTVDLGRTAFGTDGTFDMVFREEVDERSIYFLANMVRKYNSNGEHAVSRLFPSVRDADPLLSSINSIGRLRYVRNQAALLPVCFPFGSGSMTIRAKCIVLGPRFYLVAKMLGGSWPPLPPLRVSVPWPKADQDLSPIAVSGEARPPADVSAKGNGAFDQIDMLDPPSSVGLSKAIASERVIWTSLPRVEVHREKVDRAPVDVIPGPERGLDGLAMGDPDSSGRHHRGDADHADREPPDRFRMAQEALDRLTAAGKIFGHDDVGHLDIDGRPLSQVVFRGLKVWMLPAATARSWTTLPVDGEKRRSRTLYLRRILLDDLSVVYWISIEVAEDEARHAVLIGFGDDEGIYDISSLEASNGPLSRAVGALVVLKGLIGDGRVFKRAVAFRSMRFSLFRNSWGRFLSPAERAKAEAEDQPVIVPERFNDDRVFAAISGFRSS